MQINKQQQNSNKQTQAQNGARRIGHAASDHPEIGVALRMFHGKSMLIDLDCGAHYLAELATSIKTGLPIPQKQNIVSIINDATGHRFTYNIADATGNMFGLQQDPISIRDGSIAKIQLNGYMASQNGMCGYIGMQSIANEIMRYKNDNTITGAILEINSGGGDSTAAQMVYSAVKDFGKPIIALVHMAGSGGYLAACGCTEIIAVGEMSMLGSIGAYYTIDEEFMQVYKTYFTDYYSKYSGDKNAWFRQLKDNGDSTMLQNEVDDLALTFQNMVKANRQLTAGTMDSTLRGGMFKASVAKRRGLVDFIGGESLAIKRINYYSKIA